MASTVLTTDDLYLLQRLVREEVQARPDGSRSQRNARRVARKLAELRRSGYAAANGPRA
jgi:hypothetical protein